MRKWTYLVAALLMSGATATFTSCIDTEEPAGITELRGAKAQLLLAKAKVQEAEVLIKTAQANLIQARADYKQQMVEQQKLLNALQAEINTYKQDSLQREMKINEQEMNEELYKAQTEAANAQAAYEKAMIEIEIALMGYKDNAIASELMDVISYYQYSVEYPGIDASGDPAMYIRYMYGLNGINSTLREAEEDLAQYMRELSKLQFTYDINSKIAAVQGQLAQEKGTLEGLQKTLEDYKTLAGKPYEEWDAQYQELLTDSVDVSNQLTALGIEKQTALKSVIEQETTNTEAENAKSELAFEIPEAIQDDFAGVLDDASITDFDSWEVVVDGKTTYPQGVKASMTMGDKNSKLGDIIEKLEDNYILDTEELTVAQADLTQKKAINDAFWTETTGTYYVDLEAWKTALKAYQDLYNAGKYFDANLNDRAVIVAAYEDLTSSTLTGTALTTLTTAFRTQLKSYLAERVKIDGFKIEKTATPGTVIDPTDDTDWTQWQTLVGNYDNAFGTDIANDDIAVGGAYKTYKEAADKMGYSSDVNPKNGRLTEYTYAEYEEDNSTLPSGGTVNAAFEARKEYEELNSIIVNKADWDKLYADLSALAEANQKALDDLLLAKAETAAERAKIEAEYAVKETALNVEKEGLLEVMNMIKTVLTNAGATGADYDAILADLKNKIAAMESGSVNASGDDYVFTPPTVTNSIPYQQAIVASYEKLLAALQDGSYKPAEEALISQKQTQIDNQNTYIEALKAVFEAVSARKDALLAALTAE